MTWQNFQKKIQKDLNIGGTAGRRLQLKFREKFGEKDAIEELISVAYGDMGQVVYEIKINGKIKKITV